MMNVGWLGWIQTEIFLQIKFIIFQGCRTKQEALLRIFYKMLKLGFLNVKSINSQIVVFIGCNIFSVVLVICFC